MPVAMLLIDWDSKIGAVLKAKVPDDFADYYREDLNTEAMRIFTSHAMGDATAGFSTLSVRVGGEEYNVASYYTGIVREEEQYCVSLLLTPSEDPKTYEAAITSVVSPITNAVISMTDAELQEELDNTYRRIIRLAGMTDESRLARLFYDEVSRAVFPKLWKGGISKEDLEEWLKMVTGLPSVSVDSILSPFEELGLVKSEWVDEIGRTCVFMIKDLEVFRAPPLTAMESAAEILDPELAAQYKAEVLEFLTEWKKTPEDTVAIAEVLADPDCYDVLTELRTRPVSVAELEASLGIPPKELRAAIETLKKYRVISEKRRKGASGEFDKWLFLLNDIRVRLFFPEYFLQDLITELEKTPDDSRAREMVHQHLRLLRDNFPR
ncbi:ArsR family transcriptional regulator [Candidatus Thorarchaeota archaeon]|nr:MAG: ArsR family transcriptional regulator [Candidatus Thorarchaeota archaeon]